jgi:uncharacterized protein YdeI (YjbR/CyaY-like superfamily)
VTELPVLAFESRAHWRDWLAREHSSSSGIWLKIAKKDSGIASIDYQQALEEALCFGWIDGQRDRFDENWFLTRFTPRKATSRWSERNCGLAEALTERGLMAPAGLAAVAAAKSDGRWDAAYPSPANAAVPPDFQAALDANPKAAERFAALPSMGRYRFIYRLHHVNGPDARVERIARYVEELLND